MTILVDYFYYILAVAVAFVVLGILYLWTQSLKSKYKLQETGVENEKNQGFTSNDSYVEDSSKEQYYAQAFDEIKQGTTKDGLWAIAFANSGGDNERAKAEYIKRRAVNLEQEEKEKVFVFATHEISSNKIIYPIPIRSLRGVFRNITFPRVQVRELRKNFRRIALLRIPGQDLSSNFHKIVIVLIICGLGFLGYTGFINLSSTIEPTTPPAYKSVTPTPETQTSYATDRERLNFAATNIENEIDHAYKLELLESVKNFEARYVIFSTVEGKTRAADIWKRIKEKQARLTLKDK